MSQKINPCIYCIANPELPEGWADKDYCRWCKGTGDDAVRKETFAAFQKLLSESQTGIEKNQAALNWWWDWLNQGERDTYIAAGSTVHAAYDSYLQSVEEGIQP